MKSKFKIFSGFGLLIVIIILLTLFIQIIITKPHKYDSDFVASFFWMIIAACFTLHQILTRVNSLTINNDTLIYTNILTRKTKEIHLKEIDGYTRKFEMTPGFDYELITLRKENENLLKISSFYYSNFKEIKKYLEAQLKEIGDYTL